MAAPAAKAPAAANNGTSVVTGTPARTRLPDANDPAFKPPAPTDGNGNPPPGPVVVPGPITGPVALPPPAPVSTGSNSGGNTRIEPVAPTLPLVSNITGTLTGSVAAPASIIGKAKLIGDAGAGIVANNTSRIISNNGSGLIGNNGAGIISERDVALIGDAGAGYRILAASGPEGQLAEAYLYLTDRDERFFFDRSTNRVFTSRTDRLGNYAFPINIGFGFPVDRDVIVNALLNDHLRMTGYLQTTQNNTTMKLNIATTVATEFLRGEAYRTGQSLKAFDHGKFQIAVGQTDSAIITGDISAVETRKDSAGENITVGTFDLRMDRTADLRNQYAIAISATDFTNAALRALSDTWKSLFGYRPTSVTTTLGSGGDPTVNAVDFDHYGFATGDERDGAAATPAREVPIGSNYGVAAAKRGDIFVSCYTAAGSSGHIRWIHPDGKITSLWLPTYALVTPLAICIEKEPTDDLDNPGMLLVADSLAHMVYRVPMIDEARFGGGGDEQHFIEIVAGEGKPFYAPTDYLAFLETAHPHIVDGAAGYEAVTGATPANSRWRYSDEGDRKYLDGSSVPKAARYAHLSDPSDVEVDEQGNIYIAEQFGHRVRFIPKADGMYFGYKTPTLDGDQHLTGLSAAEAMKAGCIYTIAGNPTWAPAKTPGSPNGRWFGEYADSDNGPAQLARFDQPYALAFDQGALYVADFDNQRVRRIIRATGHIETVAGSPPGGQRSNGQTDFDFAPNPSGTGGDGGPATSAQLSFPRGLAFDARHDLYIADTSSGRIRKVDMGDPTHPITTVAGRLHEPSAVPTDNFSDGEALRWVDLYQTEKIDFDRFGNLLVNDLRHQRLRKLWRQWE